MTGLLGNLRKLTIEKRSSPPRKEKKTHEVLYKSLKILGEATRETVNQDKCVHALQDLYIVSEQENRRARIDLVRQADERLIPLLLHLLWQVCPPKTHVHNLALVLLNNLSTETENQRFIALDCGAVRILAQLLCEDPSCHLLAICLVNLSFTTPDIRRDWIAANKKFEWMQALTYCIQVGSMTHAEYHLVQPFLEESSPLRRTPSDYLGILRADRRTRSWNTNLFQVHETLPAREDQLFPETVRWCLCILKNLTRPHALVDMAGLVFGSGVVPFLFQYITLCHVKSRTKMAPSKTPVLDGYDMVESPSNMSTAVPLNAPDTWVASSCEDAALYVLMNLAADEQNHQHLVDLDAVLLLSLVTQFAESHERDGESDSFTPDHLRTMDFQSLKARVGLAFLLGSRGHFGQRRQSLKGLDLNEEKEALSMSRVDVMQLVEVLANTLHCRGKPGAGGYEAYAMSPKMVIKAVRCLLVEYKNQIQFLETTGTRLNSLLLKAIAMHVFGAKPAIDADGAESAALSLYFLSNHGFTAPFLPSLYAGKDPSRGPAIRVLSAFARTKSSNPAVRHASQQLVQRIIHLRFGSSDRDAPLSAGTFQLSDFLLPTDLLKMTKVICLPNSLGGTAPRHDLFSRPIVRRRTTASVAQVSFSPCPVEWFPNVLAAVQDIIFESLETQPSVALDDIAVAMKVAQCADGDSSDVYGSIWAWRDDSSRIKMYFEGNGFQLCTGQNAVGKWARCG